jgi:small Trp-rich protein
MYFVAVGVILLALKYLEIGPPANWDWWVVLLPFAAAVVWWMWADGTGWTKKKAMEREDQRKAERIEKQREAMGMLSAKSARKQRGQK